MAFNWLGMFGISDYMHLRSFLLNELRNVNSHALQIDVEIKRIGNAGVIWKPDEDGNATEQRIGFYVDQAYSTLGKLLRAYIAQGGNPFDVCDYFDPEEGVEWSDDVDGGWVMTYLQPYGGLLTVKTRENPTSGFDTGGELIWHKNPRLRIGKSQAQDRAEPIAEHIVSARGWANAAIKQKRSNLEWQIIKLLDLREQLVHERRYVLGQAVAEMVEDYDLDDEFTTKYTLKEHLKTLDSIVFAENAEAGVPAYGEINVQNMQKGFYDFITPPRQLGEDDWVGLKTPMLLVLSPEDRYDVVANLAAPNKGEEVDADG